MIWNNKFLKFLVIYSFIYSLNYLYIKQKQIILIFKRLLFKINLTENIFFLMFQAQNDTSEFSVN